MPAAAAAAVILITLGAAAPVAAHATQPFGAPSPDPLPTSESGLRKSLDELNIEAEKLTEKYNKTRVDLDRARKAAQAAAQAAAALEAQALPARERLGQ